MDAPDVIARLGLTPHPEGGHYRETWRAESGGGRAAGTAIYYLLQAGEVSRWHRIDSAEIWHWYAGDPLELLISADGRESETRVLGNDLSAGQSPQIIIAPHAWQSARSLGAWSLVGCTVSPGFDFKYFEMAPAGWQPAGT